MEKENIQTFLSTSQALEITDKIKGATDLLLSVEQGVEQLKKIGIVVTCNIDAKSFYAAL